MTTINPTDPRLTAFVLGELSAEEADEIQTAVEQSVELQAEAAAIREIVAQIESAMCDEPLAVPPAGRNGDCAPQAERLTRKRRWLIPAAITAVAATLVVAVTLPLVLDTQETGKQKQVQYESDMEAGSVGDSRSDRIDTEQLAEESGRSAALRSRLPSELPEIEPVENREAYVPRSLDVAASEQESHDQPEQIAQRSRPLTEPESSEQEIVGLHAQGNFTVDAAIPVQQDSFEVSVPAFGAFGGYNSAGMDRGGMGGGMGGMPGGRRAAPTPSSRPEPMPMPRPVPPIMPPIERPERPRPVDYNDQRNEAYKQFTENDFLPVKLGEFSTFSIDVDTASYTTMRRYVKDMNQRPPVESVRLEEYLNYFTYDYAQPEGDKPFATHVEVFPCPWQPEHLLARIGIKGKEYSIEERPPLNLVFLVDVSGSMSPANRLPLVKQGLTELVEKLQPKDRVAIVTYANNTALALPSVSAQEKRAILDTINGLRASGGTYGESGIKLAYDTARRYFDKEAQNRVILCTDGDFNIGTTDNKTLEEMIAEEAKSGVFLTILGFGMGNIKDDRLKTLSMRGNGNYGYIESIEECRKLLVEGLSSTLFTIAKDVKIQVDFNPAHVAGYRLLGYENRKLRDEDFHNDAVDAGDIGAGHTVTALYEIVPVGVRMSQSVDSSRYDAAEDVDRARSGSSGDSDAGATAPGSVNNESEFADEVMFVKLRYKEPDGERSSLLEYPVKTGVKEATGDSQFASAVALYGMLLRSSRHSGKGNWDTVLELVVPNTMEDKYREEFIDLVKKAKELR